MEASAQAQTKRTLVGPVLWMQVAALCGNRQLSGFLKHLDKTKELLSAFLNLALICHMLGGRS